MRGLFWRKLFLVLLGQGAQFQCRLFLLVQALIFWHSCRFTGALMRSLCLLAGGLGRFVPCSIGANHCRLRHIGCERCRHGLTSRLRESASEPFLSELLQLFYYPPWSARALLAGTLPLRYCAARFATRAARLLVWLLLVLVWFRRLWVHWVGCSGPGRKRLRPKRKTPAHLVSRSVVQSRPRVWKRLRHVGLSIDSSADYRRRRYDQRDDEYLPVQNRTGVGEFPGRVQARVSRFARVELAGSSVHA